MRFISRTILDPALRLGLLSLICLAAIFYIQQTQQSRIENNQRQALEKTLKQVLPASIGSDINLERQKLAQQDQEYYPILQDAEVHGVILPVVSLRGYNGQIHALVAINKRLQIIQMRIQSHRETPGLGNAIDIQRSNWILQFNGKSLYTIGTNAWQLKKDGGQFDHISGATISSRAVVDVARSALQFVQSQKPQLFPMPAP